MTRTEIIMGLPITIEVVDQRATINIAINKAFAEFRRLDQDFSPFKPDSLVTHFNQHTLTPEKTTAEFHHIQQLCQQLQRSTNGYFNAWRENTYNPSGLVKGWAIAQAANILQLSNLKNFAINAGGDMVIRGHSNQNKPWSVGIKYPSQPDKIATTVHLSNIAIATSGTYERGNHIYNPHTNQSATDLHSVTVIGPDICLADAWATALFAMGQSAADNIAHLPKGYQAYIITSDNQALITPGWHTYG